MVLLIVTITLITIDFRKFMLYFMVPHLFGQWGIVTMNLLQHDGCDTIAEGKMEGEFNHSRNFTGWLLNFLTMNNGYHTVRFCCGVHGSLVVCHRGCVSLPASHVVGLYMSPLLSRPDPPHEPGESWSGAWSSASCLRGAHVPPCVLQTMHWSKYPEAHKKLVKPNMHPALEQPSMVAYMWRACVYPGIRETYDHKPVDLSNGSEPDEDWMQYPEGVTAKDVALTPGRVAGMILNGAFLVLGKALCPIWSPFVKLA